MEKVDMKEEAFIAEEEEEIDLMRGNISMTH